MINNTLDNVVLNTGVKTPLVGLGTWKSPSPQVAKAVTYALTECVYRHIDCAAIYRNEKDIGTSLNKVFSGGIRKREEIFITSKLWNTEHRARAVRKACEATLADF